MTDDGRIPEPEHHQVMWERTRAVARQLIGLHMYDANELATRSGRHLRIVKRDGEGLTVRGDLQTLRISIETEGDIIVGASAG